MTDKEMPKVDRKIPNPRSHEIFPKGIIMCADVDRLAQLRWIREELDNILTGLKCETDKIALLVIQEDLRNVTKGIVEQIDKEINNG